MLGTVPCVALVTSAPFVCVMREAAFPWSIPGCCPSTHPAAHALVHPSIHPSSITHSLNTHSLGLSSYMARVQRRARHRTVASRTFPPPPATSSDTVAFKAKCDKSRVLRE